MKRIIIAAALTASLTGCYQVTSHGDISFAQKVCESHGGINHITVHFGGTEGVKCQDEHRADLHIRQ